MSDNLFWDTDEPYQYFRKFDARTVILGGCDRPAESVRPSDSPHAALRAFLDARLAGPCEVTHQWSGTLFETADGLPYIAPHPHQPKRVWFATGFGGNGMVMGTLAGRILSDLACGVANPHAALFDLSRTGVVVEKPAGRSAPAAGFFTGLFGSRQRAAVVGESPSYMPAARVGEIADDRCLPVTLKGRDLAVFAANGMYYALDNACSHAGGPLCQGTVERGVVTCPWHGSKFNLATGAVRAGPASQPQPRYPIRVREGVIEVEV